MAFDYKYVKEYIEGFGYKLISKEYKTCHDKLEIECQLGHLYKATFTNFKNHNKRCPICNQSTGEIKIEKVLKALDIKFVNQFKFKNCKDNRPLPFDFYLTDYNICIEYDGIQHYKAFDFFGGKKRLEEYKRHDKIKNKFCMQNNIVILRIPYWDFDNIENILKENLIVNLKETSTTKKPLKS